MVVCLFLNLGEVCVMIIFPQWATPHGATLGKNPKPYGNACTLTPDPYDNACTLSPDP